VSDDVRPFGAAPGTGDSDQTAEVPAAVEPDLDRPGTHATETIASPAAPPPGLWLLFLLVAAAGLLIGIAIAAGTRPGPTGRVVAVATIGADGGAVTFGDRGIIRIPDGAVTRPIRVSVRRSVIPDRLRVAPPDGPLYVFDRNRLVAYSFEPRSAAFASPVTIVLPLDRTQRNGAVFAVLGRTVVFLAGKVDPTAGTVTIKVSDFRFGGGEAGA